MKSNDLNQKLDADFRLSECRDEWEDYGKARFVAPQFRQRSMGIFLDNAREITRVYTAVFPSPAVLEKLSAAEASDALLLTHHAMTWDIRLAPTVFTAISPDDMEMLRRRRTAAVTTLDARGHRRRPRSDLGCFGYRELFDTLRMHLLIPPFTRRFFDDKKIILDSIVG